MRLRRFASLFVAVIVNFSAISQGVSKKYPVVGEPIPEFTLNDVHYYSKKTFNSKDERGKWVILDFWHMGCAGCVRSFPKINEMQRAFKDSVQFVLVGLNDKKYNKNIKEAYERYQKTYDLNLVSAYDSVLPARFDIPGGPYIIIIDPNGKVYTKGVSSLSYENLQALVQNKRPKFFESWTAAQWPYLVDPIKIDRKGFLYQSVLSKNRGEVFGGTQFPISNCDVCIKNGIYQMTRETLQRLYLTAWLGKSYWYNFDTTFYTTYWQAPILEIKDSSLFKSNDATSEGLYNYSLILPNAPVTKEQLMEAMQKDLKNCFGYQVLVEERTMPCWNLVATTDVGKKLESKKKFPGFEVGPTGMRGMFSMENILSTIERYSYERIPFFDETGITGGMYIDLKATMTNIAELQKALNNYGLTLEKGTRPMKVVVIRD